MRLLSIVLLSLATACVAKSPASQTAGSPPAAARASTRAGPSTCEALPSDDPSWPAEQHANHRACLAGSHDGCRNLGWWLVGNGDRPTKADPRAVSFLQCACEDQRDAVACVGLGALYEHGLGVARDPTHADALYERACKGDAMDGCMNLATSYLHGRGKERDATRAAQLYRKACERGSACSCAALGDLYSDGNGVEKDDDLAARLAESACDQGAWIGCNNLGIAFLRGAGRPKDVARAVSLFARACHDGNEPLGCYNLGVHRVRTDARGAAEDFRRGCRSPNPVGRVECCASLAILASAGAVDDVGDEDIDAWLEAGCQEKVGNSCAVLDERHGRR